MFNYKRIKRLEEELVIQRDENQAREESLREHRNLIERFFAINGDPLRGIGYPHLEFSAFKLHIEHLEKEKATTRDRKRIEAICRDVIKEGVTLASEKRHTTKPRILGAPYEPNVPQPVEPYTAFDSDVRFNAAVSACVKDKDLGL